MSKGRRGHSASMVAVLGAVIILVSGLCPAAGKTALSPVAVDLSRLLNNDGIATTANPTDGDFDSAGYTYPAEPLPPAGSVTLDGIPYQFPSSADGDLNNIVANGQTVPLPPGRYHTAWLLVAGSFGDASGSVTARYADGSASSAPVTAPDWYSGPAGVINAPYRFTPAGTREVHPVHIYAVPVWLDPQRVAQSLTLPRAPVSQTRLHLFALTLHSAAEGLAVQVLTARSTQRFMTTSAGRFQTVMVTAQNVGNQWLTRDQPARITVEADGVATAEPAVITVLAPGEIARVEVGITSTLPPGTSVDARIVTRIPSRPPAVASARITAGVPDYQADVASLASHESSAWFDNAKFGIFIHWGPYAVPAWSPVGREYAEWYWNAMNRRDSPTYNYHRQTYGPEFAYDDFIARFKAPNFDPQDWVTLIADSGARYFVYTTKHHDGFAMFDTATTDRGAVAMGPERDIVRELFDAAQKYTPELKRGLYYSLYEWYHPSYTGHPPTNPYTGAALPYTGYRPIQNFVTDHILSQMREIVDAYDPDIIWCDGAWERSASYWQTSGIIAHYYNQAMNRKDAKEVVVNNRCRVTEPHWSPVAADFTTPEYATYSSIVTHKWESNRGLDPFSYGYNQATPDSAYMTAKQAVDLLVDIVSKNGNFLLNIGPAGDGSIPPIMQQRLREIGAWLAVNEEAIFDTTYWWRTPQEGQLRFTVKPNEAFYMIALTWPGRQLVVSSPIPIKEGQRITLLGYDGGPLPWTRRDGRLVVDLPAEAQAASQHAWAFKITW